MAGHLRALVQGQSPFQGVRHRGERADQRAAGVLGVFAGAQVHELGVTGAAVDQSSHTEPGAFTDDQVAFEVIGDCAGVGFGRTSADVLPGWGSGLACVASRVGFAPDSPCSQCFPGFNGQGTAVVVDGAVDRFVRDSHLGIIRELHRKSPADLFRAPAPARAFLHVLAKLRLRPPLADLGPCPLLN